METGTMEILARIPALAADSPVDPPAARASADHAPDPMRRRPASPSRGTRPWSAGSLVLLALLAGATWAAAFWRDHMRALRQQPPARWAEAFDEGAATAGGAVR